MIHNTTHAQKSEIPPVLDDFAATYHTPTYLAWFDTDKKKSAEQKIAEGKARFTEKYGYEPKVVLVGLGVEAKVEGLEVLQRPYIRPGHYWLGMEA